MLNIFLNDLPVGELVRTKSGGTEFRFLRSYLDRSERPVLSQAFLDRLPETFNGVSSRLPSFFRNLLPDPDGRHREHVAHELGVKPHQEYAMLARLGADLPGAVRAVSDGDPNDPLPGEDPSPVPGGSALAGMQPKFSAVRMGASLRWRVAGRQSNVITKPPDAELPGIPENEYSMMHWAAASGLDVADVELTPITRLKETPEWLSLRNGNALIVKRFDRTDQGRVHIEDMAQAWGLEPDEKYEKHHYLATANLLLKLPDREGFEEFVRRIVFMAASGNADGHLKNFSLIYRDPLRPRLAPAYDLVSTIQYPMYDNSGLALKLVGGRKTWDAVTDENFRRFADKLGESPDELARAVRSFAEKVLDTWQTVRAELPLQDAEKDRIEKHWRAVPLLRDVVKK